MMMMMMMMIKQITNTFETMLMSCFITDVDECATNNGGCNQICKNSYGSYHCECDSGYELSADNHTCVGKFIFDKKALSKF